MGVMFKAKPLPFYPREKYKLPIVLEATWTLGPVLTVAENLTPNGFRSPDRPARSKSLYRIRYPGSQEVEYLLQLCSSNRMNGMRVINSKFRK